MEKTEDHQVQGIFSVGGLLGAEIYVTVADLLHVARNDLELEEMARNSVSSLFYMPIPHLKKIIEI
jgi:hypothetical protein